jgi:hypothetical protein
LWCFFRFFGFFNWRDRDIKQKCDGNLFETEKFVFVPRVENKIDSVLAALVYRISGPISAQRRDIADATRVL